MWGKIFGGTVGFMMGGPVGAFLGAFAGHQVDRNVWIHTTAGTHHSDHVDGTFLSATFQTMGYLAKTDGRVSEQEIAIAQAIMAHLRLNAEQRQAAIDHFNTGKQPNFSIDTAIDRLQKNHISNSIPLRQFLEFQLNIAYANGHIHPKTLTRLQQIAQRLGMGHVQFEAFHTLFRTQTQAQQKNQGKNHSDGQGTYGRRPTTAVNTLEQAYRVLGLNHDANIDSIKLAYRRLIRRHHPDKLAASGTSSVDLAQATEKTREITAAYERVREVRGF